VDAHLAAAGGLELDNALLQRRRMRCDQFHECRLSWLASEAGSSAERFLQTHIIQPQRVRDGVHLAGPVRRQPAKVTPAASSAATGCYETDPTGAAVVRQVREWTGCFWGSRSAALQRLTELNRTGYPASCTLAERSPNCRRGHFAARDGSRPAARAEGHRDRHTGGRGASRRRMRPVWCIAI
jgi:hypothetical protein